MKNHVFISYSRDDETFVLKLVEEFEKRGIEAWIDQGYIVSGEAWRRQIVEAIDQSTAVIFVISPESVQSKYVLKEIEIAESADKKIIPLVYQQADFPPDIRFILTGLQQFDFTKGNYEKNIDRLMGDVIKGEKTVRSDQIPAVRGVQPVREKSVVRKWLLWGFLGIVVITLMGFGLNNFPLQEEPSVTRVENEVEVSSSSSETPEPELIAISEDSQVSPSGSEEVAQSENVADLRELLQLAHGLGRVESLSWSDNGLLAAGGEDSDVHIWEPSTGEELWRFTKPSGMVNSLTWSPDGALIVSGAADQVVGIWDVASGEEVQTLFDNEAVVLAVAWSEGGAIWLPDRRMIL
jgi:hypothetical protein